MTNKKKIVSIMAALSIALTSIWNPANVVKVGAADDVQKVNKVYKDENNSKIKKLCEIPEIVRGEQDDISKYVGRIKEEEKDLHTIVLQNEDGTTTMKMYSYPVKYKDKSGKVKDISTKNKIR